MKTVPGAGAIVVNENGNVLLVRVTRRQMTRWELPTAIQKDEESILRTVFRCVEEESQFQYKVKIACPVCFCLHTSRELQRSFYGIFFECTVETGDRQVREIIDIPARVLPAEARQEILQAEFHNWKELDSRKLHPLHRLILDKWAMETGREFFAVHGDADTEIAFYRESISPYHRFFTVIPGELDSMPSTDSST